MEKREHLEQELKDYRDYSRNLVTQHEKAAALREAANAIEALFSSVIEKLTRERDEAIEACAGVADESAISSRLEMGKCEESRIDYWQAAAREAERIAAHIRALKRPIQGAKP